MQLTDNKQTYGSVSKFLHWGMFAMIIALFILANSMNGLPIGPEKFKVMGMHKSIGLTLFFLLLGRIFWRLSNATPKDDNAPAWEYFAAHGLHLALYGVLLIMPISGMLMTFAGGHPLSWFGVFDMPNLIGKDQQLADTAKFIHGASAYLLILMVAGHVGAALFHKFVRKDGIMQRMLPFASSK
ncbi:Cytochrome b561 transmembrane protein [Candidatus Terasakiella magnetica]|uniref:Cytochrome b561 transmembrane protein n=1 Tax=Candidatus Terasakiella magnetica TaxID=1867952 RepID=A0A1C3RFK5_9PROT|nr:cytochrome b [Candidatus Terasakiella magnetica]SCA56038.1 Cytochrome b561 transmembrane protein [Candidatus Terasakiella magnetica]